MILKHPPSVSANHLQKGIGVPNDFTKNKARGTFPENIDLTIPAKEEEEEESKQESGIPNLDNISAFLSERTSEVKIEEVKLIKHRPSNRRSDAAQGRMDRIRASSKVEFS